MSERNKLNWGKQITKHSCGSKSFAEVKESMRDPDNGTKAAPIEFGNPNTLLRMTKEELGQFQEIVAQQQSEENEHSMSADDILTTILGERTSYVREKGYRKRPPKKSCVQHIDLEASICQEMQAEMERKLHEEREQMAAELQRKLEEQVTSELQRKLEEEHARMDIQVDKRTQVKVDAFMIRMQQQR